MRLANGLKGNHVFDEASQDWWRENGEPDLIRHDRFSKWILGAILN